ncbi:deoxyuridine 5'-triphosphate nucleotidohydrolase [Chthonomonas calidirosea]|uniref:Deoxyuridine 5'-triphosphate nucleotidohydrolase n=1 Tax=Chthonomonas calidirosea (strain DSM 23976 / ICMP 18418 / T49) TaxID=1303518 RepID=S0EUS6_CHTCT|nr:dUTP diphosphatase [Chthonomonas calidirosea]CCW35420.1 deoxyuridine 5'-triphosphate nucleotidohydrolase [Chthonomonas calidirosea T49]CEK19347.1 deoxyuridine 5'-triphosphate nucleotidohydrolase [Chthonomonas calidirosea]CEK20329.1 deoxyuridine 5'-triphosphate nucleotidohydrolase [Chthonomonas calidirosea]
MQPVIVRIQREPEAEGLPLPEYATPGAVGLDLYAALPENEEVIIRPGERRLISTGLRIAIPSGFEGQVRARSGLALNYGIGLVNAPGTIDADFRGVLKVLLINWGEMPFTVRRGERIAQLVISPVTKAVLEETPTLDATQRGDGGFGSTGICCRPGTVNTT